ncbi:hypothetical protein KDA_09870 [Dictyobacter alpinus]|uniref:Soluble ligand binding domain-containing protein n=1 Tax=Dictyobacter alpinus TaxID=2014873 RepID=A0A402B2E4_9CHLR|nr:ComEA family DNA-binding protein [Dictyobacter alpinus]GCE25503.1 hypothetical protein KDA_09870 [Dictyobacter alpinus]
MIPFEPHSTPHDTLALYDVTQQQTQPYSAQVDVVDPSIEADAAPVAAELKRKQYLSRAFALGLVLALIAAIVWLWQQPSAASAPQVTTASTSSATASADVTNSDTSADGNIQVYITGAVQHPGVYTIASQSRVYQLLQAAGGPQPGANLAALNLATHLSDGQQIYVLHANETPEPTNADSETTKININTASADELRQGLQLSTKSAQTIINYRLQHGLFTSVDTLAKVVSKTIYAKIKDQVTV